MIKSELFATLLTTWMKKVEQLNKEERTEANKAEIETLNNCWIELYRFIDENDKIEMPVGKMESLKQFNMYVRDTKDNLTEITDMLHETKHALLKNGNKEFIRRIESALDLLENLEYDFNDTVNKWG